MEYGKGHVTILDRQAPVPPYDWEQESDSNLPTVERIAPVTSIFDAPSLRRVAMSSAVTLIIRPTPDTAADTI